ncbi:hypothetical protein BV20DRAFT_858410 [Pilatotrama ljubarskyi]|nr:hypothetical protein BV20DRAFT_858410 [Pilatotrama ljubarskyi]
MDRQKAVIRLHGARATAEQVPVQAQGEQERDRAWVVRAQSVLLPGIRQMQLPDAPVRVRNERERCAGAEMVRRSRETRRVIAQSATPICGSFSKRGCTRSVVDEAFGPPLSPEAGGPARTRCACEKSQRYSSGSDSPSSSRRATSSTSLASPSNVQVDGSVLQMLNWATWTTCREHVCAEFAELCRNVALKAVVAGQRRTSEMRFSSIRLATAWYYKSTIRYTGIRRR